MVPFDISQGPPSDVERVRAASVAQTTEDRRVRNYQNRLMMGKRQQAGGQWQLRSECEQKFTQVGTVVLGDATSTQTFLQGARRPAKALVLHRPSI